MIADSILRNHFIYLAQSLNEFRGTTEVVIVDFPSVLDENALNLLSWCDEAIVIVNPDIFSVAAAMKAESIAKKAKCPVIGAIINKSRNDLFALSKSEICSMLGLNILSSIPFDDSVIEASSLGYPVVYYHTLSSASEEFKKLAMKMIG